MQVAELEKLSIYLKKLFNSEEINLKKRPNKSDSVEFYKGEEFLGTIYKEEDEGEISYDLTISILEVDIN